MPDVIPHYFLSGETSPVSEFEFLHVETIAERIKLHAWEINPHRHDNLFQVMFLEEGDMVANIDTSEIHITMPGVILVPPTVVHGFRVSPDARGTVLTISSSFLHRVFDEPEREGFPLLFLRPSVVQTDMRTNPGVDVARFIKRIDQEFRRSNTGRVQAAGAWLKLLFLTIARIEALKRDNDIETPQLHLFDKFYQLIEQNYRSHWSVSQYAASLGVTESRLASACRRTADQGALQVVHNRLVMEAKRCLVYTNMSVSEVAYDLGYKDPGYFSRFFSREVGEAPGRFKAGYRERQGN